MGVSPPVLSLLQREEEVAGSGDRWHEFKKSTPLHLTSADGTLQGVTILLINL